MPRFAIAPTDLHWFEHIRTGPHVGTVNFWTPTPWGVSGLAPGDRLYFMLKSPIRKVGGYGTFVRYADMTASAAWDTYGLGNGVESKLELVSKIEKFAEKRSETFRPSDNPVIGCIELRDPVTLDDDEFVVPEDCGHSFPPQIVKLKYFDDQDRISQIIGQQRAETRFVLVTGLPARVSTWRKERKGQSVFRQAILSTYGHRCCITNEAVEELLEAAHIQPYVDERSNHIQNGLCLRVDLHRLFDAGLISVTTQNTLQVSHRLADTSYAAIDGKQLRLPQSALDKPSSSALEFHRTYIFR
jgi:putative restriction endonuclease